MAALAPRLSRPPAPLRQGRAEPRFRLRELVAYSRPLCEVSAASPNRAAMAPVVERVARLRDRLNGDDALQFDLAEADALHERSRTAAECAEAGAEPPALLRARAPAAPTAPTPWPGDNGLGQEGTGGAADPGAVTRSSRT